MENRLPFTDRARRAMALANQEAQRLAHDHIGTEHLLLGLVKEDSGMAAVVLRDFKLDLTTVRRTVERLTHGPSKSPILLGPEQTSRIRRVLDHASQEARDLSHNYIGTEHLLLGLLNEPEGTAARALADLSLKVDDVRAAVLRLLGKPPVARDALLEKAIKDLALHLADAQIDPTIIRTVAEGLINAGWRPRP